jgi:hypothetical protein
MDLPMTRDQAHQFAGWIKDNFRDQIDGVLAGSPFTLDMACGIACQETGIYLLGFSHKLTPEAALGRCVFDASGDSDGTTRGAFPQNTAAFRQAMGDDLTNMLIREANETRALRGLGAAKWVYKGYGIFQFDLQNIRQDEAFFREKGWGRFDQCLSRLLSVLMRKYAATHDVYQAIRAYNGSGRAADNYLANVKQFVAFSAEVP